MEEQIQQNCQQSLRLSQSLSLRTLASVRSLIVNPNTTNSTLSSILDALTCSLRLGTPDSVTVQHTLKLLTDLSFHHPHLSPFIFRWLSSNDSLLSTDSATLSAATLAAIGSISDGNPNLVPEIDDRFFVSLCFSPRVSVRLWLLRNAERFGAGSHLLFTVFLGFTRDPYPYVRKVALDGLLGLGKSGVFEDLHVIKGCYCRAVELLRDTEDCVRRAAVRVASDWGKMLVARNEEKIREDLSNAVFIQLCSMARDMSMEVRVEAFDALGKVGMVSEGILLQTLSKKVSGILKEKKSHSQSAAECFEISVSGAAGAFVHGLEDEFYEVRKSACSSLSFLTVLSEKFACEALSLLVDMLNDDSVTVRLEALETMHLMADGEHLMVKEIHMHMFLGTLADNNAFVRAAARKILKSVKLPDLELFKLCIGSLLENLKKYPQDEADVFSVLFYIGQNHGKFAVCVINEVSEEIEPDSEGKLGFDSERVAAFLVLAISVPLSCEQNVGSIQPRIYSHAVTLLGRISHALRDVISQYSLLAYLSQCSRLSCFSDTELKGKDPLHQVRNDYPNHASTEITMQEIDDETLDGWSLKQCNLREVAKSRARCQLEEDEEIKKSMNLVLAKVKNIWPLIQSGYTEEVLRTLRVCKEEVLTFTSESLGSVGALAFTLQYLKIVKLLVKVWEHFAPTRKLHYEMGELELLLGKLDRSLREIRYRFVGLSKEEELHVLELILVTCLLRLSKVDICCYIVTMKKLYSTVSQIEFLHHQGSIEPSKFVVEVKKLLLEIGTTGFGSSCRPFLFNQLLDSFLLQQLTLCESLRHVKAELNVPGNGCENPITFVSGLPVSIPFEIALHNISSGNRLWLKITMSEELTHFVFLDPNLLEGGREFQKMTYVAPFYMTPKVVSFSLRVCIGMECLFEDIHVVKVCGGPKCELAYLCREKEIYFSMASKR